MTDEYSDGYVADVKEAAKDNENFRNVIFTGAKSQLVLMSLRPGEAIGSEVHDGDQIVYVVNGEGFAALGDSKKEIEKGTIVFIPAGTQHDIVNTHDKPMKLFTIYAPPQHAAGLVEREKSWPYEAPPDVDSDGDAIPVAAAKQP